MRNISFIDLQRQQKSIRKDLDRRIAAILDAGHYIMGPEIEELEKHLEMFCGAKFSISCSSGSDALLMALMAYGIGHGDAVFVPGFTFFATAEMPKLLGATPVFVDIDPDYFQMSPTSLEMNIKAVLEKGELRPAMVIPVDLFGQPAPYNELLPIAQKYDLKVLEDAAQAFGSSQDGKMACNLGCGVSATSFFPAKPLGCYGDGGAVFTNDEHLSEILKSIRVHGKGTDKYDNICIGINGRLDTIQAAVLLAKLTIFRQEISLRDNIASMYGKALGNIEGISLPKIMRGNTSVWAQYCIKVHSKKRDAVRERLTKAGVPTNIYYPIPLPRLQAFAAEESPDSCPVADEIAACILALPFHPYLDAETIDYIAGQLEQALQ